ncbi:methylated-DNA--[protein]-cysteine S-methyltransferase [Cellvibrio polysaccharolyticus]|uniref:Methylated-DNA--protein-cysteine methyltransferase n=1 Tax=Cellvibrio polysaccharolyticus TaxID=2082724 RepID=A0A928YUC0_9GAMM|nr:methylated-DNA--[protein]-cysteine S-methyltransferase [Cellvibrio polysaccharolyticus]MBE8718511.1 methylated-DNA--[protein]-cysteine S-methyltransferase [Cellvibrio polysaccharolyticus]
MPELHFFIEREPSPVGEMLIVTDEQDQLRALDWHDYEERFLLLVRRQYPGHHIEFHEATQRSTATPALQAYFKGDLNAVDQLITATGGTEFQREVWQALREIPAGETLSYGELSQRIGRPKAVRAVGMANGANPISIVVPCHRVIGANRSLTGYGGGLDRKRWLLQHEQTLSPTIPQSGRLPGF